MFPKLGWGSYCQLCIHYCLPLVPSHQYDPEKTWHGGTFHWQSMSGWVDSVLIWDNGASHESLAPLGHIGVSSTPRGYMNGLELHWGSGCFLCVCVLGVLSNRQVPITDYQTKERKRQNKGEKNCLPLTMLQSAWEHYSKRMQQGKWPARSRLVGSETFVLENQVCWMRVHLCFSLHTVCFKGQNPVWITTRCDKYQIK